MPGVGVPQVAVRLRKVRAGPRGPLNIGHGLGKLALLGQRKSQVGIGFWVFRPQLEGLVVLGHGVPDPVRVPQGVSKLAMGLGKIGLQEQRIPEVGDGLGIAAGLAESIAPVVFRRDKRRPCFQGPSIGLGRLRPASRPGQLVAVVVEGLGIAGVQPHRLPEVVCRLRGLSLLVQDDAQIVMGQPCLRVPREDRSVEAFLVAVFPGLEPGQASQDHHDGRRRGPGSAARREGTWSRPA